MNLFPFFRPSTYRGFGEDPKSFYSVYREVFETISREDEPFMENPSDMSKIPTFGRASSDYDTVSHSSLRYRNPSGGRPILRSLDGVQYTAQLCMGGEIRYSTGAESTDIARHGEGQREDSTECSTGEE